MDKDTTHIVIPDCQVGPHTPTDHLLWAGRYITEHFAGRPKVKIVCLGDFWDMPSLSSYDKGRKAMEGRRVLDDVKAGNRAFALLDAGIRIKGWRPEKHFLMGNHEHRIIRAGELDPQMDGLLSLGSLDTKGWQRHGFLVPVLLDGVTYSHYFINAANGRPMYGLVETRLKYIGRSFTQGHQQGLLIANRSVMGRRTRGLVCGSFYLHDEKYRGPQATDEWRGIIVKHNVRDGDYDLLEVSLDHLRRRYA